MAQAARISERVLISTLADAEQAIKSGQKPSAGVLDLAKWAYEMANGKATVALDVAGEVNHKLDPSLVMAAIAQAQMDTLALDTEREASSVIESDWVVCEETTTEKCASAKCSDTPTQEGESE